MMFHSAQSNQLSLPFRKSTQISLSTAIRQYISKKYDQHPDMFRHDLEVIDSLRRDAVNVREAHPSGIKKLQAYAAQLQFIGSKFPIDVGIPPSLFRSSSTLTSKRDRSVPILHGTLHWGTTPTGRSSKITSSTSSSTSSTTSRRFTVSSVSQPTMRISTD